MILWLAYAAVGQVLVFIWMKFELPIKNKWLDKLHECGLCSGVWIYAILALAFQMDIFADLFRPSIIGQLATAGLTSYLVWVWMSGWKALHEVIVI